MTCFLLPKLGSITKTGMLNSMFLLAMTKSTYILAKMHDASVVIGDSVGFSIFPYPGNKKNQHHCLPFAVCS